MFSQRGWAGELRAGPFVVGRFGAWTLVRPDDVLGSDVAYVTVEDYQTVDAFRAAHEVRFDVWLDCDRAWWVWRSVTEHGAGWKTAGGPPEIRVK